jgi:rRNA-processing protein FCF1
MSKYIDIRSISFDTSFLLKDSFFVDEVIKKISKNNIRCFITSTVISELEQLKIWGRISFKEWNKAFYKIKKLNGEIIDFKNRLISNGFGKICMKSMREHHGIENKDIINDCNIITTSLKKGIDFILSEDFHFTSKVTKDVIDDITHAACKEFSLMCDSTIYMTDSTTFIKAFDNGKIDVDIVESNMKLIRKKGKRI